MTWDLLLQLAISLGLGLLVGLQRQWTAPHVAGLRTFALITVFGTISAIMADSMGSWVIVAGILSVAAMLLLGTFTKVHQLDDPGLTTHIAGLVMFSVGVLLGLGFKELAIVIGGTVAVLLHWKKPMHSFVQRIGEEDIRAIFQLALIALVILPILPDQTYGPYEVLNPYEIWLLVVLICGISVGGFLAQKFLGPQKGTLVGGILGGIISSTATTVSYSRRTRTAADTAGTATVVITIASTIVFGRVLFEVSVVAPQILWKILPPIVALMSLLLVLSIGLYLFIPAKGQAVPVEGDPSELKTAMVFGVLYAAVLFAVAWAKENFGERGLYVVSVLSGMTDMDAITLSTAQLAKAGRIELDTAWRMILVGAMSNLVFKGAAVALLGHRRLLWQVALVFAAALAGGGLILAFWPPVQ